MTNIYKEFLRVVEDSFEPKAIPAKAILLNEGDVANNIYFVKEGCLRLFFNNDGKDIIVQFFFEGESVASINSLHDKQPSLYSLESIEASTVRVVSREDFFGLINKHPEYKQMYVDKLMDRFYTYQKLFLSRIKNSPQQRYDELINEYPHIIKRVPQHYIASYLGITSVSLSRIRNRR
ncbi:MAG: Crp/Fnr family transcriptional regulator [Mangrovibacterium sp.]